MQRQPRSSASALLRGVIASWACAAFLSALALSVLPQWHELVHSDAKAPRHECAVTLVSAGNYQQPAPTPLVAAPAPALQFSFVVALHPVWVASPFVSARIFEHAPPTIA
jgi:hypothetical protein